jgi:outer membrane protein assembly factor BamB
MARWGIGMIAVALAALAGAGAASAEVTGAADNLRTSWYPDEPALAPSVVGGGHFGKAFEAELTGQIYAQPLVANGTLLVVTEDDWIYGIDPVTGAKRWERKVGTPVNAFEPAIECGDLAPHLGITGAPVIDTEHNVAYFVSNELVNGNNTYLMHAIDLATGNEVSGGRFPVKIEGHAQNLPGVQFVPAKELQRPALLMMNGVVYAGFGSHCDKQTFQGWIVGVSTAGALTTMWATSANGASIWQSGGGLVSDGPGQIIFSTGNGSGTAGENDPKQGPGNSPPEGRLGESVVRLGVQPDGNLKALDFFSPFDSKLLDEKDIDLGSSAPTGLPSEFATPNVPHPLLQEGKYGRVYLLNRDDLGGMQQGPGGADNVVEELGPYGGVWGAASLWPGDGRYVYVPNVSAPATSNETNNSLRFFRYGEDGSGNPRLSLVGTTSADFFFGSGSPIVTSNGTSNGSGVLWITECPSQACGEKPAVLRAYAAAPETGTPTPFWSAQVGFATKFSRPVASAGHIYVGNHDGRIIAFSSPILSPSSEALALAAPVGGQETRAVTITSTGTEVQVGKVNPPTGPFEASGLPAEGVKLKRGEAITVKVTFKPSARGAVGGAFGITTQTGVETRVSLSGTGEESAQEKAEREQHEHEAQQRGEREAKETAEREARERAASTGPGTTVNLLTQPAGQGVLGAGPLPSITNLKIRASASRLSSHKRRLVVTYTLSAPSTVSVIIEHRVKSHSCPAGRSTCLRWVRTKINLKVSGHAGTNVLGVNLGTLAAGDYRLAGTPVTPSRQLGVTEYVRFKTVH